MKKQQIEYEFNIKNQNFNLILNKEEIQAKYSKYKNKKSSMDTYDKEQKEFSINNIFYDHVFVESCTGSVEEKEFFLAFARNIIYSIIYLEIDITKKEDSKEMELNTLKEFLKEELPFDFLDELDYFDGNLLEDKLIESEVVVNKIDFDLLVNHVKAYFNAWLNRLSFLYEEKTHPNVNRHKYMQMVVKHFKMKRQIEIIYSNKKIMSQLYELKKKYYKIRKFKVAMPELNYLYSIRPGSDTYIIEEGFDYLINNKSAEFNLSDINKIIKGIIEEKNEEDKNRKKRKNTKKKDIIEEKPKEDRKRGKSIKGNEINYYLEKAISAIDKIIPIEIFETLLSIAFYEEDIKKEMRVFYLLIDPFHINKDRAYLNGTAASNYFNIPPQSRCENQEATDNANIIHEVKLMLNIELLDIMEDSVLFYNTLLRQEDTNRSELEYIHSEIRKRKLEKITLIHQLHDIEKAKNSDVLAETNTSAFELEELSKKIKDIKNEIKKVSNKIAAENSLLLATKSQIIYKNEWYDIIEPKDKHLFLIIQPFLKNAVDKYIDALGISARMIFTEDNSIKYDPFEQFGESYYLDYNSPRKDCVKKENSAQAIKRTPKKTLKKRAKQTKKSFFTKYKKPVLTMVVLSILMLSSLISFILPIIYADNAYS
ncbi:hypothetical protein NEPAR06_1049 [Nematocida parisii]|uniref:uncharacterized protein n=1 Tax=Nematocida parisii (strain ERTm1 / ATCC PRA-289) TaxID=881290 RepID=UPI000264B889|nr:uncharacterized protein NEPG_01187 [Nematocida parisii ERTm1]EIJ93615.1 hypothetical protein NEPG_01187 [Nematocida parisii ERTm1]KAI5142265.1 hypothetical protein NEPAR07_0007 [Nematocida parisii]KAI5154349.1 hypothetical protein NEPAR06_1049 [Nematocida parisii]KAI5158648.1 hypothetical protein NEPAR05_2175 [Nematocida parisii]|eukprot:XP_013059015.1 hypothetical protein NEPG_01187 [Nematocida parisii ERTm1]